MDAFFKAVENVNNAVNGVVWGWFGLALLIGTGIIVTCCTKFLLLLYCICSGILLYFCRITSCNPTFLFIGGIFKWKLFLKKWQR